jgi:hypothetical protein
MTMQANQAVDYLQTCQAIPARAMSKPMFRLVRAAARCADRAYPGMAGYYDPEYNGPRANIDAFRFAAPWAADVIPQSPRLQAMLAKRFPIDDAWSNANFFAKLGL